MLWSGLLTRSTLLAGWRSCAGRLGGLQVVFLACMGTALCESPEKVMFFVTCALCPEAFSMHVSEQFQCGENNDMREIQN